MTTTRKPIVRPKMHNPFGILAACLTTARQQGWSWQRIRAFREAATSGGAEHMQAVCQQYFVIV